MEIYPAPASLALPQAELHLVVMVSLASLPGQTHLAVVSLALWPTELHPALISLAFRMELHPEMVSLAAAVAGWVPTAALLPSFSDQLCRYDDSRGKDMDKDTDMDIAIRDMRLDTRQRRDPPGTAGGLTEGWAAGISVRPRQPWIYQRWQARSVRGSPLDQRASDLAVGCDAADAHTEGPLQPALAFGECAEESCLSSVCL